MTMVTLAGDTGLYLPNIHPTVQGAFVPQLIDIALSAANHEVIMTGDVFLPGRTGSKTISAAGGGKIHWMVGAAAITFADAGSNFRVGLQATDLAAGPPARGDGVDAVHADLVGGTDTITAASLRATTMTTGTMTLTHGQLISVSLRFTARGGSDTVRVRNAASSGALTGLPGITPCVAQLTGSYAVNNSAPIVIFEFDDGTFGYIRGGWATSTGALNTSIAHGTGSSPNEYCNIMQYEVPIRIDGLWCAALFSSNSADAEIALISDDHVTLATGKTIAITISKNGGAFGNPAAGATNATAIANGFYYFDLGTGDTDTLGPLAYRGAEGTIDDVGDAFTVIAAAGAGLTAIPWNAAWDAEVQSEVQDAIEANHLDHLLAVDYDPASKPGTATALLNELVENDGGVSRFTVNALENAPSGSGASAASIADAVWDELQADHVGAGSFGLIASEIADILADTAHMQPRIEALTPIAGTIGAVGNTTTTLHLTGLPYGNDELNDLLIVVRDVSASEWHFRWITDWVASTAVATLHAALPFTPENSVDTYWIPAKRGDTPSELGLGVIVDAVWNATLSGYTSAGSTGKALADIETDATAILADTGTDGVVVAAGSKTGYSLTATTGLGNQTANITGNLSGSVGSVTGAVGSVTGAVGSVTGNVGGNVAGSVGSVTGAINTAAGTIQTLDALDTAQDSQHATTQSAIATAGAIADAVWDEALSGHLGAGSTGEALNAAGAAGDPWTTALPGAYGAGSAGNIIGNRIDAAISTRATPAQVNTEADTALSDVGLTTTITGRIDAAISTRLASASYTAPPTANENADALLTRDWSAVTGEAARSAINALRFLRNKWSIAGGTLTVTKENDTTTAWTASVTTTAGDPASEIDPT